MVLGQGWPAGGRCLLIALFKLFVESLLLLRGQKMCQSGLYSFKGKKNHANLGSITFIRLGVDPPILASLTAPHHPNAYSAMAGHHPPGGYLSLQAVVLHSFPAELRSRFDTDAVKNGPSHCHRFSHIIWPLQEPVSGQNKCNFTDTELEIPRNSVVYLWFYRF